MRILVTGIAGFIGSNLAERLLKEGHTVVGIDNLSYGIREQVPDGVEFYCADIRSNEIRSLFSEVDVVYHLAAKNCISDCQNDPVDTMSNNVLGTANVFEAAANAKVRKIVYAESAAIYEGSDIFPTPEEECAPETFYGISKLAKRHLAEGYTRYRGLSFTALRYFNAYGPRQDYRRTIPPVMSAFIIKLLKGEQPILYGTGGKKRDFIHIDDINDFHVQCLTDARTDGETYNLGSGNPISISEIYIKLCTLLNLSIHPIYKENLEGEAQVTWADTRKALSIGWQPKIPIDDGLKTMINYIESEMEKGYL
ncbi:MAG: NAD-dependent epimerase/dehydratase family protein [bacterium]|nr:NAD-dependent epimerase/dehydratase family protein [bacterium]